MSNAICTLTRATELIPNFPSSDNAVMQDILDAAAALIEKWCNRTFAVTSYDDLLDGQGAYNLLLDNYPIVSIDRVMFNPTQVLSIKNNGANVSRATFRIDGTSAQPPAPNNLYLETMTSGVLATNTIALSGTATYADLAIAINTYSAYGWSATPLGIYSTWAVADLRPPQGGYECRWMGFGYLYQHLWSIPTFFQNPAIGEITSPFLFARGYQNYRVVYSAGFSTIPLEVQEACAELAASVYKNRNQDANLSGENLGGYSYTAAVEKTFNQLSIASRYALWQYKNSRIPKFRVTV